MQIVIGVLVLGCLGLGAALALVLRKIAFSGGNLPVTAEWIDDLSLDRYRPMLRILDGADLEFLRAQPGFTSATEKSLRRQRCKIFEGYLRYLSVDFRRVCAAIKLVMLYSKSDRPDLASALLHHQFAFGFNFIRVRLALELYRWGLCGVNAGSLMKIFDTTRIELRSLVPATVAGF